MAPSYSLLLASLGHRVETFLIPILTERGYYVRTALGRLAIEQMLSRSLDLVLLDLPSTEEFAHMEAIREACSCPLLVIGPQRHEKLLVAALEAGADDYVQRPFRTDELLARIRAQLRRRRRIYLPATTIGPLQINPQEQQVNFHDQPLQLTPEQFALLAILAAHPGYTHPPLYLIEQVWGIHHIDHTHLLDEAINALRQLLEVAPATPTFLHGDHAQGYWIG